MDSNMLHRLLLILSLFNVTVWACDDNDGTAEYEKIMERQLYPEMDGLNYPYNDYSWFKPNYPTASRFSENTYGIEGRSPSSRLRPQSSNYFNIGNNNNRQDAENRFGLGPFKLGLASMFLNTPFGNTNTGNTPSNPFTSLFSSSNNSPFISNPNYNSGLNQFDSCTTPNAESGICTSSSVCSLFGGRPSGACVFGTVCCVNSVNKCGAVVTLNNTMWTSPVNPVGSNTGCGLTVKVDSSLIQQKKRPVCQVRLDFASFSIAQPNAETVCNTDTFTISGATNKLPIICGDNNGQHMYLTVPETTETDLQLQFNFGSSTASRFWNMKIAFIPCGASYAAPSNCLQYFTGTSGTVRSFNWKDVAGTTTRQLANQAYNICFRTELVSNQLANTLCLTPCSTTTTGLAYSISGAEVGSSQLADAGSCNNDFLIFVNGFDPVAGASGGNPATNENDRFCGDIFAVQPAAAAPSITVCSQVTPFRLYYQTNGDELVTATVDAADVGNQGFCFIYQERTL